MRLSPERLLQAAAFSSTFDRFVIPPMLVAIAPDFGVSSDRAALAASSFAMGALSVSIVGIALTGVLVGGGLIFLHSTMQALATQVVPAARAMMLSLFATALFVGASLGTAALAPLAADARFSLIFALAATAAVPLLVVAACARRRYGTGVA